MLLSAVSPIVLILASCGGQPAVNSPSLTNKPNTPAASANLVFSPSSVTFSPSAVGTEQQQSVTLTNSGNAAAQVSALTPTGAGFGYTATLPMTLQPTQSQTISVSFDPSAPGAASGSIAVSATGGSTPTLSLSGTGDGAQVSVSPSSLSFGVVQVGQSATQAVTITNSGNASASVSQLSVSGDPAFSAPGVTLPITVAANSSTTINVVYAPTSPTDPTATLSLNDGGAQPVTVALSGSASTGPRTWYVRDDGGTRQQCNGLVDAAYPGSGTNQPCAFNHPFWLITANQSSSDWAWIIAGGDTVIFEPDAKGNPGVYYIGEGAGGSRPGQQWVHCGGDIYDCDFPAPPSGVASDPTRILGANAAALGGTCHDPGHTGLVGAPQLVGVNQVFYLLSLGGTNYEDIECLALTSASEPTGQDWAKNGILMAYQTNQGPANLTMRDVAVDGVASAGILGGRYNLLPTDVANFSDIYVRGNAESGWNFDGGGCNNSCENVGTINISYADVEWNGCAEVLPTGAPPGAAPVNGYTDCKDDSNGGYGDGFVMIASAANLNVSHSKFRFNTQDGFDALHYSDDPAHYPAKVTLIDNWSEGNEGQAFKLGAAGQVTAQGNVAISDCGRLTEPFAPNPVGYNAGVSDWCRAAGNQWALAIADNETLTLQGNTTIGYGATMYDIACPQGWTCATGGTMIFEDNLSLGYTFPNYDGGQLPGGFYYNNTPNPFANEGSKIDHNLWYNLRNGCPQTSQEQNAVCSDPALNNEAAGIDQLSAFGPWGLYPSDPGGAVTTPAGATAPTQTSPAVGAGVGISGLANDYLGWLIPAQPAIGALQPAGTP